MRARTGALAAVALLAAAGPAAAAPPSPVVLTIAQMYAPADLEVGRGQALTLANADTAPHDVMAVDWDADGPLFQSPIVGTGGVAAVDGVESLPLGTYQFFCSVHEYMRGTVTVA